MDAQAIDSANMPKRLVAAAVYLSIATCRAVVSDFKLLTNWVTRAGHDSLCPSQSTRALSDSPSVVAPPLSNTQGIEARLYEFSYFILLLIGNGLVFRCLQSQ